MPFTEIAARVAAAIAFVAALAVAIYVIDVAVDLLSAPIVALGGLATVLGSGKLLQGAEREPADRSGRDG